VSQTRRYTPISGRNLRASFFTKRKASGPDITTWVRSELARDRNVLTKWLADNSNLAEEWAGSESAVGTFLTKWQAEHPKDIDQWKSENPGTDIAPKDVAGLFLQSYAKGDSTTWPETSGQDLQVAFFAPWWSAHPNLEVQPVPADMVTTSGSGLDPHITLDNAMYQLDRVAAARATKLKGEQSAIHQQIEKLLQEKAEAPLNGIVGEKLINVLEVNLALDEMK
jgi:K+-transporting ATPase ATPase C chain